MFEDGRFFTGDERATFHSADPVDPGEVPCEEYSFRLLTGRGSSSQWHTLTRTGKSAVLGMLSTNDAYVEIHPADAERLGIVAHQDVVVRSRRGEIALRAVFSPTVTKGQVFIPMHFRSTNELTFPEYDPHSRQPSYKNCAVAVGR